MSNETNNTQELTVKVRLREQEKITSTEFALAIENKVGYIAEGNKFIEKQIKDDVDFNEISTFTAKLNKFVSSVGDSRLGVTRIVDEYKKSWMNREDLIVADVKIIIIKLQEKLNTYVQEQDLKRKLEEERIKKEKDQKNERVRIFNLINIIQNTSLEQEKTELEFTFSKQWATITLSDFDKRISALQGYSPKVDYDKIINKYLKFDVTYLNPDEVNDIIKNNFNFVEFEKEFKSFATSLKAKYLAMKEEKFNELKDSNDEFDNALKLKELEREEINRLAQQKANETIAKFEAQNKIQEQILENEIEAQVKVQNISSSVKGREVTSCEFSKDTDFNRIISLYLEQNGDEKLSFLKTFLIKMGCPEIKGVAYNKTKKSVNRVK